MTRNKGALVALSFLATIAAQSAVAETLIERGTYLMKGIVACGNCHTAPGGPMASKELSGGLKWDEKPFLTFATNITPDRETGIGSWSDDEIIKAIREGFRPNGGRIIGPPMPVPLYRHMSDRDARAIVAYLRQVPAVRHKMSGAKYRIPLPPAYGPPLGSVPEVPRANTVAYGEYLVHIGHCMECHTPMERGRPNMAMFAAGGTVFKGPWGESVAANLTSDKETGLGGWSAAEIKRAIAHGVRADGTKLRPPMPFAYYKNISDEDLDAVVAYLRTIKPIKNDVR